MSKVNTKTKHLVKFAMLIPLVGSVQTKAAVGSPTKQWELGPVIEGRNYSVGPATPYQSRDGIVVPIGPTAEPHYVTFNHGSLRGKSQIRMRFRIEGPGALVYGAKCSGGSPASVTLYFQRGGDDWASDGLRWWATFASVPLKAPMGDTEVVAPLNARWTSVLNMTAASDPEAFADAKNNAGRVGFTFSNCEGYGHGARATAPVWFVVTRFQVL